MLKTISSHECTDSSVDGYKWFGKPQKRRGRGWLFECIAEEVVFIRDVGYEESVWMKV